MSTNGHQVRDPGRRAPRGALLPALLIAGCLAPLAGLAGDASATGPAAGAPAAGPVAASPAAGTRTLYLIRHGVYDDTDPRDAEVGKALTEPGREQARLTGGRLAGLRPPIDALYASPMTRARQTAEIIAAALGPGWSPALVPEIKECTPPTVREDIMSRERPGAPDSCRRTLDVVWERFFRPTAGPDSTVALVCHGNVIRYFVSRTLGLDPKLWLRMTIANCSLSIVQVRPDGQTRLVAFGDAGHLPAELLTYPRPAAAATGPPDSPGGAAPAGRR